MANVFIASPLFTQTVAAANTFVLSPGWTGPTSPVSRWVIRFYNTSTFNGTLTVKARLADGTNGSFLATLYYGMFVNGVIGTGPNMSANLSTGAAAGDSLIEVDASEMEVAIDCTSYTSGSGTLTARLVQG